MHIDCEISIVYDFLEKIMLLNGSEELTDFRF